MKHRENPSIYRPEIFIYCNNAFGDFSCMCFYPPNDSGGVTMTLYAFICVGCPMYESEELCKIF